ncbi:MAG: hypothetical protein ABFS56_14965 [Pseudomonadota bacterium]
MINRPIRKYTRFFSRFLVPALKSLKAHSDYISSVAFSPDGKTALSGSWDNTMKWWDLSSGYVIKSLEVHSSTVFSVAFSPNGKTALSGNRDGGSTN